MRRTLTVAAAVVALALPGGLALAAEPPLTGPDSEACAIAGANLTQARDTLAARDALEAAERDLDAAKADVKAARDTARQLGGKAADGSAEDVQAAIDYLDRLGGDITADQAKVLDAYRKLADALAAEAEAAKAHEEAKENAPAAPELRAIELAGGIDALEAAHRDACAAPGEEPAGDDPADEEPADTDDRVCADFDSQAEAQAAYAHGNRDLADPNGDGVVCEDEFAETRIVDLQDDDQVDVIPSGAPETGGR